MKLKNKFLIILFLLFILLFIVNINNSYAFTFNDINDNTITLNDLPDEVINKNYVLSLYNGVYSCFVSNESDGYFYKYSDYIRCTSNLSRYNYTSNGTWSLYQTNIDKSGNYLSYNNFIYSNSVVYTDIDKTDVFFQIPVQEVEVVVPALEKVEELPKAMVKTLKVIIPVGLVLLGIILLIYLIKRVIYLSQ